MKMMTTMTVVMIPLYIYNPPIKHRFLILTGEIVREKNGLTRFKHVFQSNLRVLWSIPVETLV